MSGLNIRYQHSLQLVNLVLEQQFAFLQAVNQELILVGQRRAREVFNDQIQVAVFHLKFIQGGMGRFYLFLAQH